MRYETKLIIGDNPQNLTDRVNKELKKLGERAVSLGYGTFIWNNEPAFSTQVAYKVEDEEESKTSVPTVPK